MPTPTFTWSPGYAPEAIEQPRLLIAQFGDGYQQRSGDGINNNPQVWSLTFMNVSDVIAGEILAFLRAGGGALAFFWTPPRESTAIAVICRTWRRQIVSRNANVIQATFEQVPELGLTAGGISGVDWEDGAAVWD